MEVLNTRECKILGTRSVRRASGLLETDFSESYASRPKSRLLSKFRWKGASGKFRPLLVRLLSDRYLTRTIENE